MEEVPSDAEDQLAAYLAARDDDLASAVDGSTEKSANELPAELREEVERHLRYLGRLRQALTPDGRAQDSPTFRRLGRFLIGRELGRGGFGVVFQAYDPRLGRDVALKVPRPEVLITPELRERFRREARAAAALDHPNLVPIYEADEANSVCYLVSAYCPGITLARWLQGRVEPVPWRDGAEAVITLAEAVYHAHCLGVIHRDLKPANVLLTRADGTNADVDPENVRAARLSELTPRITDFGLARHTEAAGTEAGLTRAGAILGTACYMAPEQARGHQNQVGPAADIYALGAILYELVTGRPPFEGESELEILQQVRDAEPLSPIHLRPRLPRDLDTICLKCLEKDPGRRYATARALALDLGDLLAGKPIRARPVGKLERLSRWTGRNRALTAAWLLGGIAVLSMILAGIGLAFVRQEAQANRQLEREQMQTVVALRAATQQHHRAERLSAVLALERGLTLCERAEVAPGLLWLCRALALTPEDDLDLQRVVRCNLGGWMPRTHALRATFPHRGIVRAVAYGPDGHRIGTACDDGAGRIWDVRTGAMVLELRHSAEARAVAFSRDGRMVLTASIDGTARTWDSSSGTMITELHHPSAIYAACFSPDGKLVATGGKDRVVRLWTDGIPTGTAFQHPAEIRYVAFSPDGSLLLTAAGDGHARVWEVRSGRMAHKTSLITTGMNSATFSPDGSTFTTGTDHDGAQTWDTWTGEPLNGRMPHRGVVTAVTYRPDGRIIMTAGQDNVIRFWSADSGQPTGSPLHHRHGMTGAVFSPDGRLVLTASEDRQARLWELAPETSERWSTLHPDTVVAVAFSPDNQIVVTGSGDGSVYVRHAATGKATCPPLLHESNITSVAIGPDGQRLLTTSADKTGRLWHLATGKPIGPPLAHREQVLSGAFSPDGLVALTAGRDDVRLWDATSALAIGQPLAHPDWVTRAIFNARGTLVMTACRDGKARLWTVPGGRLHAVLAAPSGQVVAIGFSPRGERALTGDRNGNALMWDVTSGRRLAWEVHHKAAIGSVAFSPDGKTVLTASQDKTVRLWDAVTGESVSPPCLHEGNVWAEFSNDGLSILTCSWDGSARIWDGRMGIPEGPAMRHSKPLAAAHISPNGQLAVTGAEDALCRLWPVPSPIAGRTAELRSRIKILTGLELAEDGGIYALEAEQWQALRRELDNADRGFTTEARRTQKK